MNTRTAAVGVVCMVLVAAACRGSDLEQRQEEVAEAGGAVMPFDLDATTHVFEKLQAVAVQQAALLPAIGLPE